MRSVMAAVVIAGCVFAHTYAQAPQKINFQAKLSALPSGAPVNGVTSIVFTIYDDATAGTAQWTETIDVDVDQGMVATILGDTTPIDSTVLDGPRWLGVKVGTDAEMTPRFEMVSAPYAIMAESVGGTTAADISAALALKADAAALNDANNTTTPVGWTDLTGVPATFPPSAHVHDGADITTGLISDARYTSYTDLTNEGVLNNDSATDLLTRGQLDTRYIEESQANSVTSAMIVDGTIAAVDIATGAVASAEVLDDSLTAADMQDNPGVEYIYGSGVASAAPGATRTVRTVAITAPAAGYVTVFFSGWVGHNHTTGNSCYSLVDINTTATMTSSPNMTCYVNGNAAGPSGWYVDQFCIHKTFQVLAGDITFYGLLQNVAPCGAQSAAYNTSMTAIFTRERY